jgi:hypothetical protein
VKKKIIISVIIFTFLAAIGVIGFFLFAKDKDVDLKIAKIGEDVPKCSETNEFFTHVPVDFEDLDSIVPLGNLNPSGHTFPTDHMYLNMKRGGKDMPVYAPGDVWVTEFHRLQKFGDDPVTDYSVNFTPCEGFEAYYIHILKLSDKLQAEFDKNFDETDCRDENPGGVKYKFCIIETNVKLVAGELVGTVGRDKQSNFDLGANDRRQDTSDVAQYTKWKKFREDIYTTVCPLDYFTPKLKTKLYSLVGYYEGERRTVEPICGTVKQDVWGSAQGVWFLSGAKVQERGSEDEHAALVHDNFDPTKGVFSIGTSMEKSGLSTGAFQFDPKDSGLVNRDFDQVKSDGKIYCYENESGSEFGNKKIVIILQLTDESTLKMEHLSGVASCGSGPWQFSSNATEFER